MRIYVDIDLLELVEAPAIPRTLDGFQATLGDTMPLEVQFIRDGIVQELAAGTEFLFYARTRGITNPPTIVSESVWTKTGTGTSTIYSANISFGSSGLWALFNITPQPRNVTIDAYLEWGVSTLTTATLKVSVAYNDEVVLSDTQLDDLLPPDDNTNLDATTSAHGLLMKLAGGTTKFLRADGTWVEPTYAEHGSSHVSTGSDPVPDVISSGASGLMSGTDKTKLDQIGALQFVSPTGSDSNAGTEASPKATIEAAKDAVNKCGTIIVMDGDYTITTNVLDLSDVIDLKIIAAANASPRFNMGNLRAGASWTKTAGLTNVYQCNVSAAYTPDKFVFEHGTSYRQILDADRHSLHRGRTYALDTTPLWPKTSTADIDGTAGTFYWDNANRKLYIHTTDSSSPITNGKSYYIPSNVYFCTGGNQNNSAKLEIHGIEVYYPYTGFDLSYIPDYKLVDCRVVGATVNGFMLDRSHGTDIRCEAAACGNDGFNIHQTLSLDANYRSGFNVSIDPYSHDNYDDGIAHHERCEATIIGGLLEFNRDRGIDPAYGAHVSCFNTVSQKNGYNNDDEATLKGEGFCAIGAPTANEGGLTTDLDLFNCISRDNNINIGVASSANNVLRMHGGTVGTASGAAKVYADTGKIYLYDVGEIGTGTSTDTANGGVITITNSSLIT